MANVKFGIVPDGGYQSFDIADNKIYICGGHMKTNAYVYVISYEKQEAGSVTLQAIPALRSSDKIIKIIPKLTVKGTVLKKNRLEIEGLKVDIRKNGNVDYYVNFITKGMGLRDSMAIYKFTVK